MNINTSEKQNMSESAGICDHCSHCIIGNTGGNGFDEPTEIAAICEKTQSILEPLPESERPTECIHFNDNRI